MSTPHHTETILPKNEQAIPKPEEEAAQKKKIPKKIYSPGVNSASNKY